ncbi:AraC family transcriptional regulator [Jiulongibacter sediminis]|jgi:hypothetical protein|uniref:AraC family transcriptional regulator n=1 Tax=Jiulongibacter sediminis TaxID=1605367 RepID=UPI0026F00FAA|nr:AraC family transcriptional regulator [Jiulongibacter sediminis]
MNRNEVPVLTLEETDRFHFGDNQSSFVRSTGHHLFHINRVETYRDKLVFPLPPHRKITYDFIFLTKGSSVRSKGLSEFTITANSFFFLPAYQITEHRSMSKDVEGFYVHFSPDIFQESGQMKVIEQFSFYDFLTYPLVEVDQATKERVCRSLNDLLHVYQDPNRKGYDQVIFKILDILTEANVFYQEEGEVSKTAAAYLVNHYKDALSQKIYQLQKVSEYAEFTERYAQSFE